MDKILRALYESRSPLINDNAEIHAALDRVCRAENALLNAHSDISDLLIAYQSAQIDLFSMSAYQEFVSGFCMGARMMLEIMEDTD